MVIDPRGPRFAAALTTVVLAIVLLTGNAWLLAAQTVVFALGAFAGLARSPYSAVYRRLVRPRLAPPTDLESAAPPRFAQGVGFGFGLIGTIALVLGASTVGLVAVGLALAAAFLNAAFGFCLGCEVYLIGRRLLGTRTTTVVPTAAPINEEAAA
ncbi:MAG: DUF4395 domain-containing protein [Actinomycetes bacterium]